MRVIRSAALFALVLCCSLAGAATPQLESKLSRASALSVDALWKRIGDFCGIAAWNPGTASCKLSVDGKRRTLTLSDGGVIVEELVNWDDAHHAYTYRIVSAPLPVKDYQSTLSVRAGTAGGSVVTWEGRYQASGASDADAKKAVEGVYTAGLGKLTGSAS